MFSLMSGTVLCVCGVVRVGRNALCPLRNCLVCDNNIIFASTNSKVLKTADQANTLNNLLQRSAVMLLWEWFL